MVSAEEQSDTQKQLEHSYRTANYYLGGLVIIMQSWYIDSTLRPWHLLADAFALPGPPAIYIKNHVCSRCAISTPWVSAPSACSSI